MWELMVEAAQNPALHWAVIALAILAWIFKVLSSGEGPLMGDLFHDEMDSCKRGGDGLSPVSRARHVQ